MNNPNDNWQHRSARMRCSTCMWYVVKCTQIRPSPGSIVVTPPSGGATTLPLGGAVSGDVRETPEPMEMQQIGRCRRHAPTMNGYPAVFPTDWCGDHKLDEEKL